MRLIDADAFDRSLASREFSSAMLEAQENDTSYEHKPLLYSTDSFRDVMKNRPTVDAVPEKKVRMMMAWLKNRIDMIERLDNIHRATIAQQAEYLAYHAALKQFQTILDDDT